MGRLTIARITTEPGTRLEQLHQQYAELKAAADEAAERLKAVVVALKVEMTTAAGPDFTKVVLATEGVRPVQTYWKESWRLDTTKFKAEQPELYVRYAKKGGTWVLDSPKTESTGEPS